MKRRSASEPTATDPYRSLVEYSPDAIAIHADGVILFANPAAAKLMGAGSPDQLVGRQTLDFVPPEDQLSIRQRIQRLLRGEEVGEPREEQFVRLDGTRVDVEVRSAPILFEGRRALQLIAQDITERKRDRSALERLAARFDRLTTAMPEVFWGWDASEKDSWYTSPAVERIFGRPREEFLRNPRLGLDCIHPEDQPRVWPIILERLRREPYDLEYRILRPDGRVRWVRSRSFPTLGDDGELRSIAGITEDITKRKEIGEILAEAEHLTGLGHAELRLEDRSDPETVPQRWSAEMYRICGFEPGSVVPTGRLFMELVHPEDRGHTREALAKAVREGGAYDVRHRIIRPSGEVRFVHGRGRIDRPASDPSLYRMVGTLLDVTDSERAKQTLEASERKFREIFESSLDAIGVLSARGGRYLSVNPRYERLTGYHAEELIGRTPGEMNLWADRDAYHRAIDEFERNGRIQNVEAEIRRKTGDTCWILFSALTVELDGIPSILSFARDITEKRASEEAERRSTERFQNLFNGLPLGIYRTTPDGRIEEANPAFVRISGFPDLETLKRTSVAALYGDPVQREQLRTLLAEHGAVSAFESALRRFDGSIVPTAISARAVRGPEGEIVAYEGIVADTSARRAMEEDLKRARDEALASERLKSAFLANMSHEIRTPLNVILGFESLIAQHLREVGDRSQDEYVEGIQRAGRRLLTTIHGILDISKFEAKGFEVKPDAVDLVATIERQIREFLPMASARGIRLVADVETAAVVRFDEYCLGQALSNLIDNAVKFTKQGRVSVALHRAPDGALVLDVCDTGVGVDAQFLPRLFDVFSQEQSGSTRPFEGSGLGLALVKNYVEANGAKVMVESTKGVGSTFRVRFPEELVIAAPFEGPPASAHSAAATAEPSAEGKPTVLVVEDDPSTQQFMRALLRGHFDVLVADDEASCLSMLAQHGDAVRVVLMDLSLKGADDGLAITRRLRADARWSTLPIVAVTAHAFGEDRKKSLDAGCDDYLAKPIDVNRLLAKVSRLLSPDVLKRG